jgi:hypothetical protein
MLQTINDKETPMNPSGIIKPETKIEDYSKLYKSQKWNPHWKI